MKFSHWNGDEARFIRQGSLVKIKSMEHLPRRASMRKFTVESSEELDEYELREVTDYGPLGFEVKDLGNFKYEVVAYTD